MSGAMAQQSAGASTTGTTVTDPAGASTSQPNINSTPERVTLRLVPRRKKKGGVRWAEDTVDNEGMGRKSSKKCCIFHKKRAFGDWSDDEDSDEECDCPDLEASGSKPPADTAPQQQQPNPVTA